MARRMSYKNPRARRRGYGPPVARKRRTWVTALRTGCTSTTWDWDPGQESCSTVALVTLFSNAILEAGFSDRATIRRIIGDIWLTPVLDYSRAASSEELYTLLATEGFQFMHVGLLNKGLSRDPFGVLLPPKYEPVSDNFDYSDAEWLKTWQHMWQPGQRSMFGLTQSGTNFTPKFPVYKPDVHTYIVPGVSTCNPLASGTGDICIETTGETECVACDQGANQPQSEDLNVSIPQTWQIHLDIKKRLPMREDRELYLHMDWANWGGLVVPDAGWFMRMYSMVKVLVEMG